MPKLRREDTIGEINDGILKQYIYKSSGVGQADRG